MKIAVLSGKGGTGKTFISANLAALLHHAVYADCDVEAPNGRLLFMPRIQKRKTVTVPVPVVDVQRCTGCRTCVAFCKFNALAFVAEKITVFDDICHSCGGCVVLCPEHAIEEQEKEIGEIEYGLSDNVTVISGILHIGEASGIPIIKAIWQQIAKEEDPVVIDCPPGSACSVMESIKYADYCIMVAEPTIFGLHNLQMIYELVRLFHKPYGVVLNKCLQHEWNPTEEYCWQEHIPVLGKMFFDAELGAIQAEGGIAVREFKRYHDIFLALVQKITSEAQHEAAVNS